MKKLLISDNISDFFNKNRKYWQIKGKVVYGNGIGSKIGFPTANIKPENIDLLPNEGVYAVFLEINGELFKAMLNIGIRPTFDLHDKVVEANIFNFNDNIYHKNISVYFVEKIRDEIKFDSKEKLISQLLKDKKHIINILKKSEKPQL